MNRKELLDKLNFGSINEIPDEYLKILVDHHEKVNSVNKKECILLSFINYVLEKNGKSKTGSANPTITKLSEFININRDNLLFTTIPEKLSDDIKNAFKIIIKEDKDSQNCASLYIKKMVKHLPNYTFSGSRKDVYIVVDGVKKKKPMMIYCIFLV